jgi:hypothetical protein
MAQAIPHIERKGLTVFTRNGKARTLESPWPVSSNERIERMSIDNHTTVAISRNTARDRIKLVIKESLAEVGLKFDGLVGTHFITPGVMVFCVLVKDLQGGELWEVAQTTFYAFNTDFQLVAISKHGLDHFQLNLRVDVQAALADAPTNEAA